MCQTMLTRSYKKHYPFTLCCPSFIYPAGYTENVRQLGAYVDEIELLLLESDPDNLPSKNEIKELRLIGADLDFSYNVHLPTDLSPGSECAGKRDHFVEALNRAIDRAAPLSPTSYTLHLPYTGISNKPVAPAWLDRIEDSTQKLLAVSGLPAETIALETLDYPFPFLDPILDRFGFAVCLDTGHLMVSGIDCRKCFDIYKHRIIVMHIHGVNQSRDHLALDNLNAEQTETICSILSQFRGTVSLEVFSINALAASLDYLSKKWDI